MISPVSSSCSPCYLDATKQEKLVTLVSILLLSAVVSWGVYLHNELIQSAVLIGGMTALTLLACGIILKCRSVILTKAPVVAPPKPRRLIPDAIQTPGTVRGKAIDHKTFVENLGVLDKTPEKLVPLFTETVCSRFTLSFDGDYPFAHNVEGAIHTVTVFVPDGEPLLPRLTFENAKESTLEVAVAEPSHTVDNTTRVTFLAGQSSFPLTAFPGKMHRDHQWVVTSHPRKSVPEFISFKLTCLTKKNPNAGFGALTLKPGIANPLQLYSNFVAKIPPNARIQTQAVDKPPASVDDYQGDFTTESTTILRIETVLVRGHDGSGKNYKKEPYYAELERIHLNSIVFPYSDTFVPYPESGQHPHNAFL